MVGRSRPRGLIGATLIAGFAGVIADALAGIGQEIFNASILMVAVVMLIWHNVWMASHGRELAADVKRVGDDGADRLALDRRARRGLRRRRHARGVRGSRSSCMVSSLRGPRPTRPPDRLASRASRRRLAWRRWTYFGLVTIPPRRLFAVTTLLISFLAAGLASQAVVFLQQAGVVTARPRHRLGHLGHPFDSSLFGRVLHTPIGYSDQPSVLQVVVYVGDARASSCPDEGLRRIALRSTTKAPRPRRPGGARRAAPPAVAGAQFISGPHEGSLA